MQAVASAPFTPREWGANLGLEHGGVNLQTVNSGLLTRLFQRPDASGRTTG